MEQKSVGHSIGMLSNQIRRRLDTFSVKNSMSGAQGRVLHFILAQPGDVFQKDIEEEFCLRPPSATGTLQLMEKNGLITRIPTSYDARLKRIVTTPKANQLKEQVMHDVQELEDELTEGISEEELEVFFRVIQKMSENLSI
ncbi:MAG: MarR family winged helix-turn-helix transcriptional regulator [bacterium]|nr:MarR family winged helix-turn-helix transcriptional regulator [bacterium]